MNNDLIKRVENSQLIANIHKGKTNIELQPIRRAGTFINAQKS